MVGVLTRQANGWNPLTDIQQNLTWEFGQAAQAGESYNFNTQQWDVSALAELCRYRFLSFSYGGTELDHNSATATDTFKIGFLSNFFFALFKNQPPASMAWMENLNLGPAFSIPVFSGATGHRGTLLADINFRFGS